MKCGTCTPYFAILEIVSSRDTAKQKKRCASHHLPPTGSTPMNKPAAHPPRWYQPWRPAEGRVQDPADLGTCYGLEMTLSAEAAPTKTAAAPTRRLGWVQRLTAKGRAAL